MSGDVAAVGVLVEASGEVAAVAAVGVLVEAAEEVGSVAAVGVLVEAAEEVGTVAAVGVLVEVACAACNEGVVAAVGLLVEVADLQLYDVRAVNAKVTDLFARIRAEEARVRDLLEAGVVPDNDLRGFLAAVTGFREEIKACRRVLDARDVLDALVYPDPADSIRLWLWERALRSQLVTTDGQLRVAQEITAELIDNRPGRTYSTRSGDTLQSLSARFFGAPDSWRRITEANPDLVVGELVPGTILNIPETE